MLMPSRCQDIRTLATADRETIRCHPSIYLLSVRVRQSPPQSSSCVRICATSGCLRVYFVHSLATEKRHVLECAEMLEPVENGLDNDVRVFTAEYLGGDLCDAEAIGHRV